VAAGGGDHLEPLEPEPEVHQELGLLRGHLDPVEEAHGPDGVP